MTQTQKKGATPVAPFDPFDKSFAVEYELARRIGDQRFGSECKHEHVKGGRCTNCLRRVVTKIKKG